MVAVKSDTPFSVRPLHEYFAAEITGLDLLQPLDEQTFQAVLSAFDEHSVLVFPGQTLSNEAHVAFSERFGPLETMLKGSAVKGPNFAAISNVDPDTDQIFAPDDHRMVRSYSNELWHTDSSFKAVSAWASLLHAKEAVSYTHLTLPTSG